MINISHHRRLLFIILALALALRLIYGLAQDHLSVYDQNRGDSWWYLEYGRLLMIGNEPGPPPSGPVYLIWVGIPQHLLNAPTILNFYPTYLETTGLLLDTTGASAAVALIRLVQALLSTATCYLGYRLAWTISKDERAGLLTAGVLAFSPVFVLESAQILTETLYLFLISSGLWLYITASQASKPAPYRTLALVGVILGIATLTRAVLLAFPLGLVIHLIMVNGWRKGLQRAVVLIVVYMLVVSTWTIYMKVKWNQWVIGAQGFAAFLYLGATEWQGPTEVDNALEQQVGTQNFSTEPEDQQELYQNAAAQAIGSNPLGWLSHRATELTGAYLQPHGTLFFPGESLKDLAVQWWTSDRTITGLLGLTQGDSFWPKLLLYVLHFAALIFGLWGMWFTRRNWRVTLPLIGLIIYTTLVHFVLDAIPRYIFPTEFFFWLFASAALIRLFTRIQTLMYNKAILETAKG
ncbi:MAG: glycosyltransferase family 39 protein [Anaerolineae bacterium]|nr:glycosyltransferase family 39 protein [Anaerolineae bacterium]